MIGYRRLDGSTVLPDGTIVFKDGSRSARGASPYPPAAEIGGLHPVTLPDPAPPSSGGLTVEAVPAAPAQAQSDAERIRELELSLQRASDQYATEKRRTIWVGAVAVAGLITAGVLAARRR